MIRKKDDNMDVKDKKLKYSIKMDPFPVATYT